jgi:FAD/FMN-containing dehydrogenase
VRHAAAHELPVAVQATGHGMLAAVEGGMLITVGRMNGVEVDPQTRTARVEAGTTWEAVVDAAGKHGLAPLSGSAPGVGVVGYTLGGGLGLLSRRAGLLASLRLILLLLAALSWRLRKRMAQVTHFGALGVLLGLLAVTELDSLIAIAGLRLHLRDDTWASLDHSHSNRYAVRAEDLGHAHLAAQQSS